MDYAEKGRISRTEEELRNTKGAKMEKDILYKEESYRKQLGLLVNFGHYPKIEHERYLNQPSRVLREDISCLSRVS